MAAAPATLALDPQPQEKQKDASESSELSRLRAELAGALAEMETMKAVAEVSESTKAEAVAAVQRQCQEEVASLQAILKDSISSYETQIAALKQERQQQQQDFEEKDRELGHLKQLLARAHPLDSLEKQMEKAHEDSEKLREIVLPMEQEITELKGKLQRAEELIQEIQRRPRQPASLHGSTELLPLSRNPSPPLEPLEEPSGDAGPAAEAFAHNCDDSASISSFSLGGAAGSASLRGPQGLSPEQEETASLVSTGTLVPEGIFLPPPGYQLVPDSQWEQLQVEGRQLQKELESVSRERDELQEGLRRSNEDCAKQMQVLLAQVQNSEQLLRTLQGTVSQAQERVQLQMAELATSHKCLSQEVKRLNEENQGLRAEQLPSSALQGSEQREDQDEALPSSIQELHLLVQNTRQQARARQQAQEHEAERLRIEIVKLREALDEETAAKASLERQLRVQREETDVLEASLCSLRIETERVQQEQRKVSGAGGLA
ncbi:rabaptin, RAB GTPase binding effector protein 2, isoform CRA_c [Mus musculus]|uniref:Isoform 3 of Rab GTPase-binding effector protein 2 n=1 Tax=Mus musculus TaxID=10090 RepID=Q91WG2-2|nr:Rabep2 protein [Mus musculus]EDL17354.1 rabaptin, RAB GTPase binding effector protein 2, isoform CRA_c [Mus musculus]